MAMQILWEAGYDLPPEEDDWMRPSIPPTPEKTALKGHCRHCGRKIGKGLHFHEKACEGKK